MKRKRTLIIVAVIAMTALAVLGFGRPAGDRGIRTEAAAHQSVALVAGTVEAMPLSHEVLPPLGPIPCLDGSTVDFGQFCPLPTIQCANGSTVPIGQFCPVTTVTTNAQQAPPPPPKGVTCPDGSQAPSSDACTERGAGAAPGVACPDGSVVQAGQQCPSPKPQPPVVLTVSPPTKDQGGTAVTQNPPAPGQQPPVSTVYLCGAGYHYEGGQCVGNGPIVN